MTISPFTSCMSSHHLLWYQLTKSMSQGIRSLINLLAPGLCHSTHSGDWFLKHLLWNYSQVVATRCQWWQLNIGSGNGLVLSSTKPLPKPMLTKLQCLRLSQVLWHKAANFWVGPQTIQSFLSKFKLVDHEIWQQHIFLALSRTLQ